jgi:hypothetical protein
MSFLSRYDDTLKKCHEYVHCIILSFLVLMWGFFTKLAPLGVFFPIGWIRFAGLDFFLERLVIVIFVLLAKAEK